MPEMDSTKGEKKYYEDVPMKTPGFFLKGAGSLDWGMKNRLSRIFNPDTGRTVMFAIDHGYFQGPTTGLERIDLTIVPLMVYADAIMLTRGILRTTVPPSLTKPVVMRCSGGPSILKELSNEELAVDIEDAIRMNVSAITLQVFIGGEFETRSVHNMTRLVDMGLRYGIPTMAVTAVGKDMLGTSVWRAEFAPSLEPRLLRRTTSPTDLKRSPLRVPFRLSWPAVRRFPSSTP